MPKKYNKDATQELQDILDRTPIINDAIEKEIIRLLQEEADPSILQQQNSPQNSLLLLAILSERHDLIKTLIETYKNECPTMLNAQDVLPDTGNTALTLCIKKGFYDHAITLLEAGCDPNIVSGIANLTPLHLACASFGTSISLESDLEFLKNNEVDSTQNNSETISDDILYSEKLLVKLIRLLIRRNASLSAKTSWGSTPIELLTKEFSDHDSWLLVVRNPISDHYGFYEADKILSVQQILNLAKTDSRYEHLTSVQKIENECEKTNGVIRFYPELVQITLSSRSQLNELGSLLASFVWHRDKWGMDIDRYVNLRNRFLKLPFARNSIDEIKFETDKMLIINYIKNTLLPIYDESSIFFKKRHTAKYNFLTLLLQKLEGYDYERREFETPFQLCKATISNIKNDDPTVYKAALSGIFRHKVRDFVTMILEEINPVVHDQLKEPNFTPFSNK